MDDQSIATAHTNETPYPGSRGQGASKKHDKAGGARGGKTLPAVTSPRSPRGLPEDAGADAPASPRRPARDDDDASHASSITRHEGANPTRGVDIGMMAQREVQKQFQLAERMHQERSRRGEQMARDAAELAQIDERIAYIKRERLDRLDADLAHRKHMHATVSKEFDAAMKRLHRLVEDQRATANRSVNRNANVTGRVISEELAAARGYSMKGRTQHKATRKFFSKAKPAKLPPVAFSPVVPA